MADREQVQEKPAIYVTVAGEKLELIPPGRGWTFAEAKLAKEVSEGMSVGEIEQGLFAGDPDAWLAILHVSYVRAGKDLPAAAVDATDMKALWEAVTDAMEEAAKLPPTSEDGEAAPAAPETSEAPS